jgi:peptide deformylase
MAIIPIILVTDPRLRIKSTPVAEVNDEIRKLFDDMLETMYHANGIGLAAIQIAIPKRLLVLDLHTDDQNTPMFMANPEIISISEEKSIYNEGCLSVPGQWADVTRPASVTITYLDYHNKKQTLEADHLLATAIQHEIDHLNGIVFIDYLPMVKRDIILRKIKKDSKINNAS